MKAKNKSFLEDVVILFILGIIIYFIYSFFFSTEEKVAIVENKTTIEKKVEVPTIKEIIPTQAVTIPVETPKTEIPQVETTKTENPVETKVNTVIEEKISTSEITDPKVKVELFYKTIKEKIYKNIDKNVDKNKIKPGEHVEFRLTILKDGGYEQLSSTKGDKDYFELFRSSIKEAFPVKIDNSLKESFPRYFRMEIVF
ncbi:MAG: hypothetical protein K2P52_10150 [Campylobacterales bacterium]|nr:hypothetical protein [Campylobacterales bacterium]